ncbi:MAG: hypothetical protein IT375_07740 [Polyangiaceae bacterium]|nr:hypothetical protein [Polyangiaceae bacterium]
MRSVRLLALTLGLSVLGCGGDDGGSSGAGGTSSGGGGGVGASGGGGGGGGGYSPETCAKDPLKTGLVAQQTGVSADVADCSILKWTAQYSEPDPMIVKAMIYGESRFDYAAIGCDNLPCGTPSGWTEAEAHCYGMMQVVPACGPIAGDAGLLANGHPNLTTDTSSPDFVNSIFNPDVNIHLGVAGFAGNRAEVKGLFPGCTEDQYTLMALGNLASHGSTKGCTEYKQDYIDYIMPAYKEYSAAAGYAAHPY